ncbi:DUF1488 family protein [Bradyrhizobium sp. STM 3562]|uniref:DUF1488 family protein n=1 Tax=Bradyrhizobium sp. STM 3562 TaxID=578924 RepID=UPI003890F2E6
MLEGLALIAPSVRDVVLRAIGAPRSIIPGIDLAFDNPPARYDFNRDVVTFQGKELGGLVNCAVSREALDDHFGADCPDRRVGWKRSSRTGRGLRRSLAPNTSPRRSRSPGPSWSRPPTSRVFRCDERPNGSKSLVILRSLA